MLYLVIKWLHILSAIVALGSNVTYGFWIARSTETPQVLTHTLRTIQYLDSRLANRGYGLLFATGAVMFYLGRWPITTSWLVLAVILYAVIALIGALAFTPILKRQIALAESPGPESAEYREVARRSTLFGIATIAIVVFIVFLMVTKPQLWG